MYERTIYTALGKAIALRRNALKMTQATLASQVGISRASIANIESGRQNVLLHHVYRLATALNVTDLSDLLPEPDITSMQLELTISGTTVNEKEKSDINRLVLKMLSEQAAIRTKP